MEILTAFISIIASLVILSKPLSFAPTVYIALLAWYPIYLTIPVLGFNFNACRIITIVIFISIYSRKYNFAYFKWILLDKLIIIYFVCQLIAGSQTFPIDRLLVNRSGAIMDQVMVYFIVRILIQRKEEYLQLLKNTLIITAPLAIAGFYECLTGHNLFSYMQRYAAFGAALEYVPVFRSGFYRANASFGETIMFGLFFAILGPVCVGLLKNCGNKKTYYIVGLLLMGIGVFSSLSSGAFLCTLLAMMFILLYKYRQYWKIGLTAIITGCLAVEIISNRHFYDVLGDFTFDPSTAWYRSQLINIIFFEGGMSGHWPFGYGDVEPGWGMKICGMPKTDIVNHYILVIYEYGLLGLFPFIAILISSISNLVKAYKRAAFQQEQWIIWCLASVFAGILPAMTTVALFGPTIILFNIILGLCGNMSMITSNAALAAGVKKWQFLPAESHRSYGYHKI